MRLSAPPPNWRPLWKKLKRFVEAGGGSMGYVVSVMMAGIVEREDDNMHDYVRRLLVALCDPIH